MTRFHYFMGVILLLVTLCVVAVGYSEAQAMPMCGVRAAFIKAFKDKFNERAVVMALTGRVNVVEVYSTKSGSTWTMIVTDTDGRTCIIAAGQNWKDLIPEIEGEKS